MTGPDLQGHSLLAIFAHPDDESLASGGLLALCAQQGARVSLLCLSRGEHGQGAGNPADLGRRRETELSDAARTLGVHDVLLRHHPDGMLSWVEDGALDADVLAAIAQLRPEVIITFGEDGLYWHPDHIAVHTAVRATVASLGAAAPALFYVTSPPGQMRRLVETVAAHTDGTAPRLDVLGIADPDAFGACAEPPTLVIHAGPCAARKLAALRCHHSQASGGVFDHVLERDAAALLGLEHYRRADVGSAAPAFIEQLAGGRGEAP